MELRWSQTPGAWIAALQEHADNRGSPLTKGVDPAVAELCTKLLGFEGIRACVPFWETEEFCRWFIDEGALHRPSQVELRLGEVSDCHGNSARLWLEAPETHQIVTGYGLSEDGMWRRHSWVLDHQQQIIETTEERILYYGIALEPEYARRWATHQTEDEES